MTYASAETVKRLTGGKVKAKAQCRALIRLGIRFRPADDGYPLVLERDLDLDSPAPKARNGGPRWDLIGT